MKSFLPQFIASLALSLIFLYWLRAALRSQSPIKWTICLSVIAFVVLILVQKPFDDTFVAVFALQVQVTFVVVLICQLVKIPPGAIFGCSVIAMLACYGYSFIDPYGRLRTFRELQREFPLVSVADRLSYERSRPADETTKMNPHKPPIQLPKPVEERLVRLEHRGDQGIRLDYLRLLHNETERNFEWQLGFGYRRMIPLSRHVIAGREISSIPMSPPAIREPADSIANFLLENRKGPTAPADQDRLLKTHSTGVEDFVEPGRIGYVVDRDHVAGFLPHRFTEMPAYAAEAMTHHWQVSRLELISLLKHPSPVAYVSEHLPRMDELQQAPTRPLNQFEKDALVRLREQEDLVVENGVQLIRMVGSVRAGKDCLQCHSVQRGELLGAFSYEIVPQESLAGDKKE